MPAGTTAGSAAAGGGSTPTGGYTIVQRFPQAVQVPGPVRLPVSLSDGDGALLQEVPATLGAQVLDEQGAALGDRIEAVRRDAVPAPYYDFHTTLETPGFYSLQVEGGSAGRRQFRRGRSEQGRGADPRSAVAAARHADRHRPRRGRSDLHPRARSLSVPRHHAHRGARLRQAGGVLRRHAGVLHHGCLCAGAGVTDRGARRLRRHARVRPRRGVHRRHRRRR